MKAKLTAALLTAFTLMVPLQAFATGRDITPDLNRPVYKPLPKECLVANIRYTPRCCDIRSLCKLPHFYSEKMLPNFAYERRVVPGNFLRYAY